MAARYVGELRAVQPRGPYRLAGWSMGGIVAYEMARQLDAAGEATDVLAVIDSASPARFTGEPERSDGELVALFAYAQEQLHGGDVLIPADLELPDLDPATLDTDTALDLALSLGQRIGLLSSHLESAELRQLFARFAANRRSLGGYEARPYRGPLHLFRAADRHEPAADPTLGWGALLNGGLRIYDVPGDHRTMMKVGAEAIAAHLRELLAAP
jgi:thioesterase domain-containing protein